MAPRPPVAALFISDLHLSAERPGMLRRFSAFMTEEAASAESLYILGDLFEYWPGDDALEDPSDAVAATVAEALRRYTASGKPLRLLHGNRDFLLGARFVERTGATLLPDHAIVAVAGEPALLLHGDSLCTDDLAYQEFKSKVRTDAWRREFLAHPLAERHALMARYRAQSENAKSATVARIMDVNAGAVAAAFRQSGVRRMIHGHTHRHACHHPVLDGVTRERWVLPDWYERGGYLAARNGIPELVLF